MRTGTHGLATLPHTVVLAVFFASGFSALVYQVAWVEMLNKVFGVTTFAASAVLGAYFGGLALGGFLGGRLVTRRSGLRLYAVIEIALGVTALVLPRVLAWLTDVYTDLYPLIANRQFLVIAARFFLSLAVLLVPATLIGMALPVLVRALTSRSEEISEKLTRLYGWNTFGSVLGALLTGYLLIGFLGLRQTTYIAVAVNIFAGVVALWVARFGADAWRVVETAPMRPSTPARPHDATWRTTALTVTFCSGFAALGYEVAWFRVLGLLSDHRAHTFSAIVALVLIGIAAGSLMMGRIHMRVREPASMLGAVLVGLGISGFLWLPIITGLSAALAAAASVLVPVPSRSDLPFAVALVITFVPCLLMGMSFPLAVQIYTHRSGEVGESVGRMYALNLIGAMLGSVATGFVLLPLVGAQSALTALSLVFFLAAALVQYRRGRLAHAYGIAGTAISAAILATTTAPRMLEALFVRVHPQAHVIESHEDIEATVTVARHDSNRVMYINGAHQADDSPWTIVVHRLIGLVPCIVHGQVEHALVVGIGGGTTAGEIARCTSGRATIVEISPSVVQAARSFGSHNRNIVDSPNADIVVADGRNHLLVTDRRYDVMTADTIRPIHAQSGNLYSHDYYRLMASRLKTNGIVLQWIDVSLRDHEERILMRTFVSAFPHVAMSELGGSRFLLGSNEPLSTDAREIGPRLTPEVLADLAATGIANAEAFLSSFALAGDRLRAEIGEGPIISDDRPINEYFSLLRIADSWRLLPEDQPAYRPRLEH